MIFRTEFVTGLDDVRLGGAVKNRTIMKMFEDAAGFHSDTINDGVNDLDTKKNAWILMAWKVQGVRRPQDGQRLTVATWSREMKSAHAFRDYEMTDDNGNVLVLASSKWTLISTENRRIMKIPENIKEGYGQHDRCVFGQWTPERPELSESYDGTFVYKVLRRDTDLIGHMHNLNYLDLACEVLPEEVYMAPEPDNIVILYRTEIKIGDTVECRYSSENSMHKVDIVSERGTHAVIKMW